MYSHDDEKEYITLNNFYATLEVLQIDLTHIDYVIMKLFEISKDLDNLPFYELYTLFIPEFKNVSQTDFKKTLNLD